MMKTQNILLAGIGFVAGCAIFGNKTEGSMGATKKRITQDEIIKRVYQLYRRQWIENNGPEEKREGDSIIKNGVAYYQSSENGEYKPYYAFRTFDPNVTMYHHIKRDILSGKLLETAKTLLGNNEYFVANNKKIHK